MTMKFYAQRSTSYMSIVNACMVLFLTLSKLNEYGLNMPVTKYYIPLAVIGFLLLVILGYLETKHQFYAKEVMIISSKNPYNKFVIDKLNSIDDRLKEMEKNK